MSKKDPNKKTLVIYYKPTGSRLQPEVFKNCSNPDKILASRNLPFVSKVEYGGQPYDISRKVSQYPDNSKKDAAMKTIKGLF
jgi:hypothetical protein